MKVHSFNTVWLPVTYLCNNKCWWCYAKQSEYISVEQVLKDREDELIELLAGLDIKRIILIGGEPTLYSNISTLISKISKKNIWVGMVTNGRLLSDRTFAKDLKVAGLSSVTVSIEGSNAIIHEKSTKIAGSFSETLQGINNTLEIGIPTSTETVINIDNLEDLLNIVDFLEKYKLHQISFSVCGPCLGEIDKPFSGITLNDGASAFELISHHSNSGRVRLITSMPVCSFSHDFRMDTVAFRRVSTGCHIISGRSFVLEPGGDVIPCVHFSGYPLFNVYKNKIIISPKEFIQLYNDPNGINEQFRGALKRYPSSKCFNGKCWNPCIGGCPVFWFVLDAEKEIRGLN